MIGAAMAVRLPYLVLPSVAGAVSGTGVPHFESKAAVERALSASGLPHTAVAPTYFPALRPLPHSRLDLIHRLGPAKIPYQ
jgi:uncharacterized protein YbjT (DUF2867 family)